MTLYTGPAQTTYTAEAWSEGKYRAVATVTGEELRIIIECPLDPLDPTTSYADHTRTMLDNAFEPARLAVMAMLEEDARG